MTFQSELQENIFRELISPKLHITYSFVIQRITWKNCLEIIFLENLTSVTWNNVFGINFAIISGWSVISEKNKGGGETQGRGEHTINPLPKKRFWTPPLIIRFPRPPLVHAMSFSLEETGTDQTNPTLLRGPKSVRNSLETVSRVSKQSLLRLRRKETVSRLFRTLFGPRGWKAPGDSLETLSGFRARWARETPVRGGFPSAGLDLQFRAPVREIQIPWTRNCSKLPKRPPKIAHTLENPIALLPWGC